MPAFFDPMCIRFLKKITKQNGYARCPSINWSLETKKLWHGHKSHDLLELANGNHRREFPSSVRVEVSWCGTMPIILASGRPRQEGHEFEASLDFLIRFCPKEKKKMEVDEALEEHPFL